ncbi:hypothetical protein Taro_045275 [Colocasia esculenta]|uniref:Uncharacterized protein n=1 Tax=Colocasia esculenta TaxID=4460 RepID=A0A843X2G0_COLES|nr:hypothetical protein [Colocasia esculenta]
MCTTEVCVVFLDTLTHVFELYIRLRERRQGVATCVCGCAVARSALMVGGTDTSRRCSGRVPKGVRHGPATVWSAVVVLIGLHCSLARGCGAAIGPFVRDCETERLFLCYVVRVGYWRHEPVVRSRVVASLLSDSCFAIGCGLCVVTCWLRFYPFGVYFGGGTVVVVIPWWYLVVVGYLMCVFDEKLDEAMLEKLQDFKFAGHVALGNDVRRHRLPDTAVGHVGHGGKRAEND